MDIEWTIRPCIDGTWEILDSAGEVVDWAFSVAEAYRRIMAGGDED